ncbi:hypothetical protein RhiirA1_438307 [Rhizophagus irregularis]|uniref:Crinkler family protein n=2 Tax=Rhizophagus irregularis TaxID=588596 RepID=A0A2N0S9T7_9GLOM|nr:hypothetical protein GLOIN_2v1844611 [Rhizophagus irregularis DAOM 181602=DAOM 197198]PKC72328.1 hypothetical protein RhiirA1_438307 [Rhizophagus irregularis]POG65615.1 hypothetical protein GLOIN_2v1844611 [Rhizophagus irregularis DAOM 181602=DAOM 197198]|eukprot:XP_025172481.1 hypothetical protein GLOIN_2v1844611 [Rhizophagus irregularis DAOM 181602=DAOM 197198]
MSNVAGSSTGAVSDLTIEVVKGWSTGRLNEFLKARLKDIDVHIDTITDTQKVDGDSFLELAAVDFERWGVPGGPAKKIERLIKEIQGAHQPLEPNRKRLKTSEALKKTWKVNSTLRETDWSSHYFVDPAGQEQQDLLFRKIEEYSFIMLYGTRASGKSTRVMRAISVLEESSYVCNYLSFEQIIDYAGGFWNSLGTNISIYKRSSEYLESCTDIKTAEDFLRYFSITGWKEKEKNPDARIILFFDEFDRIYKMDERLRTDFPGILRAIRNNIDSYVIQAIVVIGTFSILHLDSSTQPTSPFNIRDSVRNPNFDLEQVRVLFREFEEENKMKFESGIIEDIFEQTNGHAGLVCICGRAIEDNLLRELNEQILNYKTWERYKVSFLMNAIVDYVTFRNLVRTLLNPEAKNAVNFFRNHFLVDFGHEINVTTDINSAEYLAYEGVLFAVKSFDKDIISLASFRSFKTAKVRVNGKRNQHVPRESVYDAELYRILRNWLGVANFEVTGQWHLISNGDKKHRYSDIVIDTPFDEKIVLELLATADTNDLDEPFQRALDYARLFSATETWIVHFTCEDNYVEQPHWPSRSQLQTNLNVAHFYHDHLFTKINLIAGWWSNRNNKMVIYEYSTEI